MMHRMLMSNAMAQEKVFAAALDPKAAKKQCRQCLAMLSPKVLEDPIKCTGSATFNCF